MILVAFFCILDMGLHNGHESTWQTLKPNCSAQSDVFCRNVTKSNTCFTHMPFELGCDLLFLKEQIRSAVQEISYVCGNQPIFSLVYRSPPKGHCIPAREPRLKLENGEESIHRTGVGWMQFPHRFMHKDCAMRLDGRSCWASDGRHKRAAWLNLTLVILWHAACLCITSSSGTGVRTILLSSKDK